MRKRLGRAALVLALAGALGGGVAALLSRGSSVPTGTLTVGQTLYADPSSMVDTAKAVLLIDAGKAALCRITISGATYFANPAAYVGQNWYRGLSALVLAQSLSPAKGLYDTAGNALTRTTIGGNVYCAAPARWTSGYWAIAFAALAQEREALVASPSQGGPSIR